MVRTKSASVFLRGHVDVDPSAIAAKALNMMDEEVEKMPPHKVIRQADMQRFWGTTLKNDEVSWDAFWLHFPERLPKEAAIDTNFGSLQERTAFQRAVYVVGAPDYVTVSMIDAAFPPGCSIRETTARLLKKGFEIIRNNNGGTSVHQSSEAQRLGFWDLKPSSMSILSSLACEIEAELVSVGGQHSSVAHVQGHMGSGAMSVALESASKLLSSGFWSQAVYIGIRGARSAEIAAARLASALGILSFPVITNELLRLTTFLHARSKAEGRLGIVLDAEGCKRADELHGLSVLITTLIKAGKASVQVIAAGEGSLELSQSIPRSTFLVQPSLREHELAMLTARVPEDYLEDATAAIAAACSHQPTLLELVAANLLMGNLAPHPFVRTVSDFLLQESTPGRKTDRGTRRVAHIVTTVILQSLTNEQQDALVKLAVLPSSFTLEAATVVLGVATKAEAAELLSILQNKEIVRQNSAYGLFGIHPLMLHCIGEVAELTGHLLKDAATAAFVEYCLHIVDDAAALNASHAQAAAMWVIDRERPVFDELVNLLDAGAPLPAVTHATYAEIVSRHMDLLAFRLGEQQQQELCSACAQAAREMHDVLGEAKALQHLGLGSAEAADEAMARAMGTVERALTPTHPVIADILLSRAHLQNQAQNYPKAERLLKRCLDIQQRHSGGENKLLVAATQTQLGGVCIAQANPQSAEHYLKAALQELERTLVPSHPDTALARCRLASCMADLYRFDEAHALYLEALADWRDSLGHCHPHFAVLLGQLAFCCSQLKKLDAAENYYRRSIQMWKEMHVLDQQELQSDLQSLIALLYKQGRQPEAVRIHEQLHRLSEAVKAAQIRTSRKPKGKSVRLRRLLLAPLKVLCYNPKTAGHALALPAGIQDSDLEELRVASLVLPEAAKSSRATGRTPRALSADSQELPSLSAVAPAPDNPIPEVESSPPRTQATAPMVTVIHEETPLEKQTSVASSTGSQTEGRQKGEGSHGSAPSMEVTISFDRRPPFVSGPFKERVKVPSIQLVPAADQKPSGSTKHSRTHPRRSERSTQDGGEKAPSREAATFTRPSKTGSSGAAGRGTSRRPTSRPGSAAGVAKVKIASSESQAGRAKEPSGTAEVKLIQDIRSLEQGLNSPHTEGELIPAHAASSSARPSRYQRPVEHSDSDLSDAPLSGYDSGDGTGEMDEKWTGQGYKQAEAGRAARALGRVSPNKVTGFINPMYSNQDGKEGAKYEQNPVFEM